MLTKQGLKAQFAKEWKKHYEVGLFRQKGFMRKACPHCGKHFWTLDADRKTCGTPPCEGYGFIGKPVTKERWDYVQAWQAFEKFFVKNGHASIPRYPVIDRWRPDLYFTIASIQDFQRIDAGSVVMEYPADPLIVPQVCLRFNDIPNVGVTGRHHTCFVMPGQHSFGSYWKDRTIELNFGFINKVMGVPEKEITYLEDMWAMPDFSQFGPSLETFCRGLELVNSVFSQFAAHGSAGIGYKELPQKVVDVGWGHERLVWFTNGTVTGYDAVFEPVVKWMLKKAGLKETDLFTRYSSLAGSLTVDEVDDMNKMRSSIANQLGVTVKELNDAVEPMQAVYAIADHAKALLFAITDGGIPSNVGGGYNLRVILRRALSFIDRHELGIGLEDVAERHARHMKPMFPELSGGLRPFSRVLAVETERYRTTGQKSISIVHKELQKGIGEQGLVRLYVSNGISPEEVQRIAKESGQEVSVPEDIYSKITGQHMAGEKEKEAGNVRIDVSRLPATKRVYYENPYQKELKAKVAGIQGDWVALDSTIFYPEGGGQPADEGVLVADGKQLKVTDVQKIGSVILHKVPKSGLRPGQPVEAKIDWDRRHMLMKMHTATHVLAGVARKAVGRHVWQAGAQKGLRSSRIDLTHYERFGPAELAMMEKDVNEVIAKGIEVDARFYPRSKAEAKYGFVLYQGGSSPGREVRVVSVKGLDVEACGGTHLANTKEIGRFKIIRAERIQDGINRIEFTVSDAAEEFLGEERMIYNDAVEKMLKVSEAARPAHHPREASAELAAAASVFSVEPRTLPQAIAKFGGEVIENQARINKLSAGLGIAPAIEKAFKTRPESLSEACAALFALWKLQNKEIERMVKEKAKMESKGLASRAVNNEIFEVVKEDRKSMIEMAGHLIDADPKLTVILANQAGDIIAMSRTRDMGSLLKGLCQKAGGSGGGREGFAQGRVELSKLVKVMGR